MIDLSFTTVKYSVPAFIYGDIRSSVAQSNSYHHQPNELIDTLSRMHSISRDTIYLTAGADQAINAIIQKFGDNTVVFTPTYIGYSDAERFGHTLTQVTVQDGQDYKIDTKQNYPEASLIIITNPNNPFGITSKSDVIKIVENNPKAIVLVDEAYGEFDEQSVITEVENYPNLVVVRSFSKSYGLAGFRIGYIVANTPILDKIVFETTWFNVSYASVGAAISALNHHDFYVSRINDIKKLRQDTVAFLVSEGFTCLESYINAIVLQFQEATEAKDFVEFMKSHDILVNLGNGLSNIGLDDRHVRVSIGSKEHMQIFRDSVSLLKK